MGILTPETAPLNPATKESMAVNRPHSEAKFLSSEVEFKQDEVANTKGVADARKSLQKQKLPPHIQGCGAQG